MGAAHLDQITDEAIAERLAAAMSAEVEWTGRMPARPETWDELAAEKLDSLTVDHVRDALTHDLRGDGPRQEIEWAISIAAEPDELPEGGSVVVQFG